MVKSSQTELGRSSHRPYVTLVRVAQSGTQLELPNVETLAPILGQLTFGALAGFAAGYALKKIGKFAAITLGLFFLGVQLLAYYGLVEINWLQIQEGVDPLLRPESLQALWRSLVDLLTLNLPFAGAFVPGLLLGLQRG